jgi:D-serine deaminase-like pyridoxal phosphate-dependent protein
MAMTTQSSKFDLMTPALLVDLDRFESNIQKMQSAVSRSGKHLRPHAKAHKCVEISRRQMAAGAVGVCVATIRIGRIKPPKWSSIVSSDKDSYEGRRSNVWGL